VCALDLDAALADVLGPRYAAYATEADARLRCRLRAHEDLVVDVDDAALFPGARVEHAAEVYRFRRRDLDATLDLAAGTLDAVSQPTLSAEAALRIAVSLALPRRGGLLLHSSGVVEDGRGHVFSGPSGAGKTTTVRLLRPRP